MSRGPENQLNTKDYWSDKAGDWIGQAETVSSTADRFNVPLLDACKISTGDCVLDLASGAGEPCFSALTRVGEAGTVIASDISFPMIQGLRLRKTFASPHLLTADMQQLPFGKDHFDKVLCRFGIMFVPDVEQALGEIKRVLRPGGRVSFAIWESRDVQTMFSALAYGVEQGADIIPDAHHMQIFRFAGKGTLSALLMKCGFEDITDEKDGYVAKAPLNKTFWHPQLIMTFGRELADKDEGCRQKVDLRIKEWLDNNALQDGRYHLETWIRLVSGTA